MHDGEKRQIQQGADQHAPCDDGDFRTALHEVFAAIAADDPTDGRQENTEDAPWVASEMQPVGGDDVKNKHAADETDDAGDDFNSCRLLTGDDFPKDENDGRAGFDEEGGGHGRDSPLSDERQYGHKPVEEKTRFEDAVELLP